jgi:hypothetical protein
LLPSIRSPRVARPMRPTCATSSSPMNSSKRSRCSNAGAGATFPIGSGARVNARCR